MPEIIVDPVTNIEKDDPKATAQAKESPSPDTEGESESTSPTGPKDPKQ
jgi:hypothetical protein